MIIALAFLTLVAVGALALASLGFTSQKAANVHAEGDRLVGALESGLQGAIEEVRVREPFACPATVAPPLVVDGHAVTVECDADADATLRLVATSGACPIRPSRTLEAIVTFSTIGDGDGARIARITAWRTIQDPCPTP
ncbi:MAG: hypothetical protein Q8O56_01070 [Solirubrobacteraceae bacterium]|nr:hypothetical protein [Solirubrobacteraceae bacterium]